MNRVYLQVRNSREDETTPEAAASIFSSLISSSIPWWKYPFSPPNVYTFEIIAISQKVYFYITCPSSKETLIKSLIAASYPQSLLLRTKDPFQYFTTSSSSQINKDQATVKELALTASYLLPIKTYQEFANVDTLSSFLGFISKVPPPINCALQLLITPATFPWKPNLAPTPKTEEPTTPEFDKSMLTKKAAYPGGKACIRLLIGNSDESSRLALVNNIASTFGALGLGGGNSFKLKKDNLFDKTLLERTLSRQTTFFERRGQILNSVELASIWHPPGKSLSTIKNIQWGKTLSGEPPENLPTPSNIPETDKKDVNFFAKAEYKNTDQIFGIKTVDRRKHVYIIGKTGTGKSTLIANMAIDDIRRNRGIGVIDPHGDLSEIILDYIPKRRLKDVVYLEPFDSDRPFHLNVLEIHSSQQRDLVASGIVSIFAKIYGGVSWGPRLEYILRNVIMSLLEIPGATLVDALNLLSDNKYRQKVVPLISDPVVSKFWTAEFAQMTDKLRVEAVSPIQNKVGQFVTSKMIRQIIGHSKSTINLKQIMDEGKILILNLSQGKLGEDNATLLGAMFITQLQLAAMSRSFQAEEDRRDFFLYVDEFQNFATTSFIKILSEARKYRLCLTLANQYIQQLDEDITKAIFGNVGTLISFLVGATDGAVLTKEFGGLYSDNDLVSLGKFETVLKLSVDGMTSRPFPAKTLPLPALKNDKRLEIVAYSKEKYGRSSTESVKTDQKVHSSVPENDEVEISSATKPLNIEKNNHTPIPVDLKKTIDEKLNHSPLPQDLAKQEVKKKRNRSRSRRR